MNRLDGRTVALSASFPSGARGEAFRPYDAAEVADAVTALARAVFSAGGRLVFGGHPTVTPLVLHVAGEHRTNMAVDVFQTRWFAKEVPAETLRFQELGLGRITWTPRMDSLEASLREMRSRMINSTSPVGAVFIGGMEGILDEWHMFGELRPDCPRIPILGPGGAAAQFRDQVGGLPSELRVLLTSQRYAVLANEIVRFLEEPQRRQDA